MDDCSVGFPVAMRRARLLRTVRLRFLRGFRGLLLPDCDVVAFCASMAAASSTTPSVMTSRRPWVALILMKVYRDSGRESESGRERERERDSAQATGSCNGTEWPKQGSQINVMCLAC
jgi:hypothetical protein